jgi:hypothetical protein
MAEPFFMFQRHVHDVEASDRDYTDEISRIDKIEFRSLDKGNTIVGNQVHGGDLMPRDGR